MSPQELTWRLVSTFQDSVDRIVLPRRQAPVPLPSVANGDAFAIRKGLVGRHLLHTFAQAKKAGSFPQQDDLVAQARRICGDRLSFFGVENQYLGTPIRWNYECKTNRDTPRGFAAAIDYRDHAVTGDCKFVWEPNRHQHLVVLGRAYQLTGYERYAAKAVQHVESWIQQCPYGAGMNWRSPLELAIRLINWVWTYELIGSSGAVTRPHLERVLPVVYRHMWEISRKYSRYSSANNHLIGEAAGVFIGSSYFSGFKRARAWQEQSRRILLQEIVRQTHEDGGHRELAMGYHLFVLEFFSLAGFVARNVGRDFPAEYWKRLESMYEFLAAFVEGGTNLPMFNDCDDGYVLDLGNRADYARGLLGVGAELLGRDDFRRLSNGHSEPAFWLFGPEKADRRIVPGTAQPLRSRALPTSGFYLLQCARRADARPISVVFDCGPLGFGAIAAHGHADALSFTVRAFGSDLLVDPGTYDYFTSPRWRNYFRSTRAHNTIVIDDRDQSERLGPFLWGRKAAARCLQWEPRNEGGTVVGEHDGYAHLPEPVVHRRTVILDGNRSDITVHDELRGPGRHKICLYLHLAEQCSVVQRDSHHYAVEFGNGNALISLDPRLTVSAVQGREKPISGWVSRGYHRKTPATTLVARGTSEGIQVFETRIAIN